MANVITSESTGISLITAGAAAGNALLSNGAAVAPIWGKIGLTTHISGTLAAGNGGTDQSSYTIGDLLYASGATALSKLADIATGNALISGGVGAAPSYGKIGLTTHISGTLAAGNGGTGITSLGTGVATALGQAVTGSGGIALETSPTFGGITSLATLVGTGATDASSSTTGAFKTAGGMGIAKKLYVGTILSVGPGSNSYTANGAIEGGQASIYGDGNQSYFTHNTYFATGWKSSSNATHNQIAFDNTGKISFNFAAASIATTPVVWQENVSITSAGGCTFGVLGGTARHTFNGNIQLTNAVNGFTAGDNFRMEAQTLIMYGGTSGFQFTNSANTSAIGAIADTGAWAVGLNGVLAAAALVVGGSSYENSGNDAVEISTIGTAATARATLIGKSGGTQRWRIGSSRGTGLVAGAVANDLVISSNGFTTWFSGDNGVTAHGKMVANAWTFGAPESNSTQTLYGPVLARGYSSGGSIYHEFQNRNTANSAGGSSYLKVTSFSSAAGLMLSNSSTDRWLISCDVTTDSSALTLYSLTASTVAVKVSTAGSCTFGSTATASTQHNFLSNGNNEVRVLAGGTNTNAYLTLVPNGTGTGRILNNSSNSFHFANSSDTSIANFTNLGAWTWFSSSGSHNMRVSNADAVVRIRGTDSAASSRTTRLQFEDYAGTIGDVIQQFQLPNGNLASSKFIIGYTTRSNITIGGSNTAGDEAFAFGTTMSFSGMEAIPAGKIATATYAGAWSWLASTSNAHVISGSIAVTVASGSNLILKKGTGASLSLWGDDVGASNTYGIDNNNSGIFGIYNHTGQYSFLATQAGVCQIGPTTPSSFPGPKIVGQNNGSAVAATHVGEIIEQVIGGTALLGYGTPFSYASVSLTAGKWAISYVVLFQSGGATFTANSAWVSTVVNSSTGRLLNDNYSEVAPATNVYSSTAIIADYIVNITGAQIYHLTTQVGGSGGSPVLTARLRARRIL